MNAKILIRLCPVLLVFSTSCSNLFYVPLRITAYSPDRDAYAVGENPAVWVEFSAEVDLAQAEQAFSLSREKTILPGRFSWNGRRLSFTPYEPFETGCQYHLKVAASVEDRYGNSLEREFLSRFRFGADVTRPAIVDVYPATASLDCDPFDHENLGADLPGDLHHPITISFSEPIEQASFYRAFSLSPQTSGTFFWSAPEVCVFTPAEPYDWQTEYVIRVATDLKDLEGNFLADEFVSHFFMGTDRTPPVVVSATGILPSPARLGESARGLTEDVVADGWEADWNLLIIFNEPVTEESVKAALAFSPPWDYKAVYDPVAPDRIRLERASAAVRFSHGQAYTLKMKSGTADRQGNKTVRDYLYPFYVNGIFTRPPQVLKVCYLEDSSETIDPDWVTPAPLDVMEIDAATPADGILDFYFLCAERAVIPAAAFAENFEINVENYCLSAQKTRLEAILPGDSPSPPLRDALAPGQTVLRVFVRLQDNTASGTVTLHVGKSLSDEALDNRLLHNPLAADWSLRLRDPN